MIQFLDRISQPWHLALRHLLFWLLFFAFFRLWFILWLPSYWGAEKPWQAFWQALPLDLSMAVYLIVLPISLWFAGMLAKAPIRQLFARINSVYTMGILAILVLVFGANIFVYEDWHTLLNNRALEYFRTPRGMLDSMSTAFKFGSTVGYIGLIWLWWRFYQYLAGNLMMARPQTSWNFAWTPVFIGLLFLGVRGGLGKMPINESAVYYSAIPFNNHAATNTAWHLIHCLLETHSTKNIYQSYSDSNARAMIDGLYQTSVSKDSRQDSRWLQAGQKPPNVVFILMESMTAQLLDELGGKKNICPNLSRLANKGILFENIYSSGYRTDQGLVSVLSGFPAQPAKSVVLLQDKAARLPCISKELKRETYSTAFFYGGQLTFANMGVWLRNEQFEKVVSERNFSKKARTQRWGADDFQVFQKAITAMNGLEKPFFSTILTLSLHTPFDVPVDSLTKARTLREKFLNSAKYADWAIGQFFEQAASQDWFDNTLFVLVADHGHSQPSGFRMDHPRARQVPLIFTGPLIAPEWRGRRMAQLGNHHDIPATVLNGLGLPNDKFTWSKDLFSAQSANFAYYTNENGLGWLTPGRAGFYRFSGGQWSNYRRKRLQPAEQDTAKAFLQVLYGDFLDL